jgi:hypothetical protein
VAGDCCTISRDDESFWASHQTMPDGNVWCFIKTMTDGIVKNFQSEVKSKYGNKKRHRQ